MTIIYKSRDLLYPVHYLYSKFRISVAAKHSAKHSSPSISVEGDIKKAPIRGCPPYQTVSEIIKCQKRLMPGRENQRARPRERDLESE